MFVQLTPVLCKTFLTAATLYIERLLHPPPQKKMDKKVVKKPNHLLLFLFQTVMTNRRRDRFISGDRMLSVLWRHISWMQYRRRVSRIGFFSRLFSVADRFGHETMLIWYMGVLRGVNWANPPGGICRPKIICIQTPLRKIVHQYYFCCIWADGMFFLPWKKNILTPLI